MKKVNRIGEKKILNCGMEAEIIDYQNKDDMSIKFIDGTIREHIRYVNWSSGKIKHPALSIKPKSIKAKQCNLKMSKALHIGEKNKMNCGMEAEIIEYNGSKNITVLFADGTVVKNKCYCAFKKGEIANPNYKIIHGTSRNELLCSFYFEKIGFKKSQRGQLEWLNGKELDLYNPSLKNHKVAIEYDGYFHCYGKGHVVNNDLEKNYLCKEHNVLLYRIREPQLPKLNSSSYDFMLSTLEFASSDLQQAIICILKDLFERGLIESIPSINFEKDKKEIEKYFSVYHNYYENKRLQETRRMNCGLNATIIAYVNANDMTIIFEDGILREHVAYRNFKTGRIGHPNLSVNCGINNHRFNSSSKTPKIA